MKYDSHVFANCGIAVAGMQHDTLLQTYVLESHKPHEHGQPGRASSPAQDHHYDEVSGKGANQIPFAQVEVDTARRVLREDADVTLRLHQALWPQIEADDELADIYATSRCRHARPVRGSSATAC